MVGITRRFFVPVFAAMVLTTCLSACVSTEALYAEYDATDCNFVAVKKDDGAMQLHEQNTDIHYPWEPAVYFAFDSSELSASEQQRLNTSMQILKRYPHLLLGLQGFTDKRGELAYNRSLAESRVNEVKRYLVANGITDDRIELQPIGKVLPQIGTDDSLARATNRRVELMLLEPGGRPMKLEYAMNNE